MDFKLSSEQQQIRQSVRALVRDHVEPHARTWDEEERFASEVVPHLADMGLFGMVVPAEYGGTELGALSSAIVVEELSRGDGSVGLTVASHNSLCSGHLVIAANEEQKRRYLPKLASGEWLGAWGLTEPGAGSDAGGLRTRAVRDGDHWVINGSKTFITQGSVGGCIVLLASTTPERKQRGITAFLVEHGTPGFTVGQHIKKLGMHASDTVELHFDDVRVPDSQRIGDLDHGFADTLKVLDGGRIGIGALSLGLAEGALDAAIRYAGERKQFNRTLASFQAIQHKIADMATQIEAARLLIWRSAWLKDNGLPFRKEACMAKLFASEMAVKVCEESVQIHGGYGYTRDFPVERHWRDSKLCTIGEGTSEVQRLVIARQLYQ